MLEDTPLYFFRAVSGASNENGIEHGREDKSKIMDAKGKKDASGCLVIVGLIGGFLLVKNVIWPWVVDNKESVGSWAVVVLAVTAFAVIGFFPVRNILRKQRFLHLYGKRLEAKDRVAQESKKIVNEIASELAKLEAEVQCLSRDARKC